MKGRNILIGIVLLTSIMITTIVYSAFSTQLQISGDAIVRSDNDIRVTNIKIKEQTNGAFETYNSKYTKDTTSMFVTLPSNSSITYEITLTNKSTSCYLIESISQESHTNSNVNVDISLNVNDKLFNDSTKTFNITLTNNTSIEQFETLLYSYSFRRLTLYTVNNLIPNSSFENTGWRPTGSDFIWRYDSDMKYDGNYSLYVEGLEDYPESLMVTYDGIHLNQNHKYYISIYSKSNLYTLIEIFWPYMNVGANTYLSNNTNPSWTKHSAITIKNSFETGDYLLRIDFNNNGHQGYIYFDSFVLIDLTQCFGEGNEPNIEWCDENIDYFDGSTIVYK